MCDIDEDPNAGLVCNVDTDQVGQFLLCTKRDYNCVASVREHLFLLEEIYLVAFKF